MRLASPMAIWHELGSLDRQHAWGMQGRMAHTPNLSAQGQAWGHPAEAGVALLLAAAVLHLLVSTIAPATLLCMPSCSSIPSHQK